MKDQINQSKLLLEIEVFLNKLIDSDREWSNFYSDMGALLLDFSYIYCPDCEYLGLIKFFVILYYDLEIVFWNIANVKEELMKRGFIEIRKWFLELILIFKFDYEKIENQKNENKKELEKYSKDIINNYSRVIVTRVDLGYLNECGIKVRVNDLYRHMDLLLNRIQNKDNIFKHVVGYAWGLEQGGESKGFHCHLCVIYDNAYRAANARYWGDQIIKLWKKITWDCGQGYNCYNKERIIELKSKGKLGIGIIHRKNIKEVRNFITAMEYIAEHNKRTRQYLRVKPIDRRVFGKGQLRIKRFER